jgi:hypothetical protein
MKIYANGREIEVPTDSEGNVDVHEVRRMANIPENRMLIQQHSNGNNNILPKYGIVPINPYDHFVDSAPAKRG